MNRISKWQLTGKKTSTARLTCSVLLVFLFLFALINAVYPVMSVKVFGFKFYLVSTTGSMRPLLSYSDLIVVKKHSFNKVQEGDIITFLAEVDGKDMYITHEVVEVLVNDETGERVYRTKGINSNRPDGNPVSAHGGEGTFLYIGKYAFTVPVLGSIVGFIGTPIGFMNLLTNLLGLFAIYLIIEHAPKKDTL